MESDGGCIDLQLDLHFYISCFKGNCSSGIFVNVSVSKSLSGPFFLASVGCLRHDDSLSALFLPGIILLGPHRGLAVLHGGDGKSSEQAHPQALPVSGLG